jgi:ATP-dependent exoDNAse (exonuclease V) beta subunit
VIDRLDRTKQGNWLVTDFKTDADPMANKKGPAEKHGDQVRAYALALQKALHADVKGSLYYTNGGVTVEVPAEQDFEEKLEERVHKCAESTQKANSL